MGEALQRINAVIERCRGFENQARPLANKIPSGTNDKRVYEARGEQSVAENLRGLLEEELPFDMIDHADLHYGLVLDELRVIGDSAPVGCGLEITIVGVNRHLAPPMVIGHLENGPAIEVPVKYLEGQCGICGRRLDPKAQKGDPALDCGGDCNACVAEAEGREL
jgi:hypothetical protein